jgi:hypothetical protein
MYCVAYHWYATRQCEDLGYANSQCEERLYALLGDHRRHVGVDVCLGEQHGVEPETRPLVHFLQRTQYRGTQYRGT